MFYNQQITTIRKTDFILNGVKKSFYIDIETGEIIKTGDPRLSTLAKCNQSITVGCSILCGGNIAGIIKPTIETESSSTGITVNYTDDSRCTDSLITIDIFLNGEHILTDSGDPTSIFFGSSTYTNLLFPDIKNYINSQPSYLVTNEEISVVFTIQDCFNYTDTSNIITFTDNSTVSVFTINNCLDTEFSNCIVPETPAALESLFTIDNCLDTEFDDVAIPV